MNIPRIYVACLSSYNAGVLHGEWINADQSADGIHAEIQEILSRSEHKPAEEWAIHDYVNFGGIELGEYVSIERVAKLAELVDGHGPAFVAWYESGDGAYLDLYDLEDAFLDAYQGHYDSLEHYAEEYWNTHYEIPDHLHNYIAWDRMARDLKTDGYWTEYADGGGAYVFKPD